MPITLTELILTIPFTVGLFFLPFLLYNLAKRRPLKRLMIVYALTAISFALFLWLASVSEQAIK